MVQTILFRRKRKRTSNFSFLFSFFLFVCRYRYFIYRALIKINYMSIEINKEISRKGNKQINKLREVTKILHT